MPSKKELLAQAASLTGVTHALGLLAQRPGLLILNYHRVGDKHQTPYDSGLFSCTAAEFAWQVGWLKRRFQMLTLPQALDIVHGRVTPPRTCVLLTFDDGYRDNFVEAFPILAAHQVPATFFLPTAFVGTGRLPWWDEIAWIIKCSTEDHIRLTYPQNAAFDLSGLDRPEVVTAVLNLFKNAVSVDTERFLDELATASGCPRPGDEAERCFINWDEARAMQQTGMCFGSHTHTHEILGRLPYAQQLEEVSTSRRILEKQLGGIVDTLAYPRGKKGSFSDETFNALREAGYTTAFTFSGGFNQPGANRPFQVLRAGVDGESRAIFRLRALLYATQGYTLV